MGGCVLVLPWLKLVLLIVCNYQKLRGVESFSEEPQMLHYMCVENNMAL